MLKRFRDQVINCIINSKVQGISRGTGFLMNFRFSSIYDFVLLILSDYSFYSNLKLTIFTI